MIEKESLVAMTEDTEGVLGHLFWFSIGKQMNRIWEIQKKLEDANLSENWLPKSIRPVDAFRRATKDIQTKKDTADSKIFKNYLIREVYSDSQFIQRNIVVETVDQNNRKLGYETKKGIIRLDRKNGSLLFETDDIDVQELCHKAEKRFYLYRDHYSSQHMRVMITKMLDSLAPTPMREKGVIYFIPKGMTKGLTDLVTFINSLENSDAFKVPVINSNDNKHMISKKLSDNLNRLLEQCKSSNGLRKDQIKNLVDETNTTIMDFKQYKDLATTENEDYEEQIMRLRSEVMRLIQN